MDKTYNLPTLRQLVTAAYDHTELQTAAFDLFPKIYDEYPVQTVKSTLVLAIVTYAIRQRQIDRLVQQIKRDNPAQYAHFKEALYGEDPTAGESEEIEGLKGQIAKAQHQIENIEKVLAAEEDPDLSGPLQQTLEKLRQRAATHQTELALLRQAQAEAQKGPAAQRDAELHIKPPLKTTLLANAPYGLDATLVGRQTEMLLLNDWYGQDPEHPLMAVIGLGGMGKSALTWAWMQAKLGANTAPPLVVWWSFYETDGTMDKMLAGILRYAGIDISKIKTLRQLVELSLDVLRQVPSLIILDGAERILRAYGSMGAAYQADGIEAGLAYSAARQCIDPAAGQLLQWLAQPHLTQAKTLMTSRLFPAELSGRGGGILNGVSRHDLPGLSLKAAQILFEQKGIKATRAEVQAACEPLGYHPLSLSLLAATIANDPLNPNDIRAATDFDPSTDLLGKRQHVLARAYDTLPQTAQHLLSRLAAFRSAVPADTLTKIFGNLRETRADLRLLQNRGLLQSSKIERLPPLGDEAADRSYLVNRQSEIVNHFDLHPIVRRYAYDRLTDSAQIHTQLVVYFEAVPAPNRVERLADLQPTIELYHHLVRAERFDEARRLFQDRLATPLYYQLGSYQTRIELLLALFPDGAALPRLSDERDQGWTLNALGNSYGQTGRPAEAVRMFEKDVAISEKLGDTGSLAITLGNLGENQTVSGQLAAADVNLQRSMTLCREIGEKYGEAIGHGTRGRLLTFCGAWEEAEAELATALEMVKTEKEIQAQGVVWTNRAELALLQGNGPTAAQAAQAALELAEETARTRYPYERDFVRAFWLRGWASTVNRDYAAAQSDLDTALSRCRAINLVEFEPAILLAQARLAYARAKDASTGDISGLESAIDLANQAITIAERCGYPLYLADLHNLLARIALDQEDIPTAREQAQAARGYAWCDGPPYAYRSALDEAERLLERIKGKG